MHQDAGLHHSYTIFGSVLDGLDVVDDIAASKTDGSDRPHDSVIIGSVEIEEAPAS